MWVRWSLASASPCITPSLAHARGPTPRVVVARANLTMSESFLEAVEEREDDRMDARSKKWDMNMDLDMGMA